MAFAVEAIPDDANLFRRIHQSHLLPGGKVSSAAFKQERMSVNWEKYSDAPSTADENSAAVAALISGACRTLNQTVEHTPVDSNQSHTEVCGDKTKAICSQLRDIAQAVWFSPLGKRILQQEKTKT